MKKLIAFFIAVSLLISCCIMGGNHKKTHPYVYMSTRIEQTFSYEQFDSLCVTDHISRDLNDWNNSVFIDEDGKLVKQFLYITKKTGERDTTTVYSVIPKETTLVVNKREEIE